MSGRRANCDSGEPDPCSKESVFMGPSAPISILAYFANSNKPPAVAGCTNSADSTKRSITGSSLLVIMVATEFIMRSKAIG